MYKFVIRPSRYSVVNLGDMVHGFFVQDLLLKVLFVLQMHLPTMNKKASNSENVARDKPHPGKSGSECDSARKENLLEDGGDMEPPTEGMAIFSDSKG